MSGFRGALALLGLALVGGVSAQQLPPSAPPPVTFKVEINYVDVDVVVTDQQGSVVRGLTKDDFELREDGRAQSIDLFTSVDIPMIRQDSFRAANRPISSDVKSNAPSAAGRLYVLVLDDLDVTALRSQFVIKAARQFIERNFADNDLAAVVYTSGRGDASQEFTSDRRLLLASVDKFAGRRLLSLTLAKADEFFHQHLMELQVNADSINDENNQGKPVESGTVRGPAGYPGVTTDPDDFERGYRAQQVLGALKNAAVTLGGVRGRRKALLLFSEGIDYPIYDVFGSQAATSVIDATKAAIAAAAESNLTFFTIDPRGLVGMSAEEIELSASADPTRGFDAHGLVAEMRLSQDSLRVLAEETGGLAAITTRNVTSVFDAIVRTASTYYLLGYYPPEHPRNGAFHKIEVRVKRPGLRISARKGYSSPNGQTPQQLSQQQLDLRKRAGKNAGAPQSSPEMREVLKSPLQQTGLALSVQAASFKAKPKEASVALAIEVDGSRLHFDPPRTDGTVHDDLELSFVALDDKGKSHEGTFYGLNLTLKPDTYERVRTHGLRLNPRVPLPPGRYQLRLGVREGGAGEMGSVYYDLDVPDFGAGGVTLSGLLLTAGSVRVVPTFQPDTTVSALTGPATSRREFRRGETINLFAEIYDNVPARQSHRVDVTTSLLSEDGRELFRSTRTFGANDKNNSKSTTFAYTIAVPLADASAGRCLLRVEAAVHGSGDVTGIPKAVRETTITVQ